MRRFTTVTILIAALIISIFPLFNVYSAKDDFRVAYIEGDPYVNYAGSLSGIISGLSDLGLVDSSKNNGFEEGSDDASVIWNWLKGHSGQKIEFVQDEFYQLIFMSDEEKRELVRHLAEDDEIDLILVMGTAAAKFMKENQVETDMMVMSVSNAREAGIIEEINYSGIDNIWAHMSPNRYYNQLNVFQDLFQFKKLGIVYEDSETGRSEISYGDIKRFAEDKGIQLIEIPVTADKKLDGPEEYEKKMIDGYHQLEGKADAVYMTNCGYRTAEKIPHYLAPIYESGIPVFSQTGKNDVKNGATLTIFRYSFQEIGSFCAAQFKQIMEGERPGELIQSYDESQTICFNLVAAERAGLEIPFKVLLSADTIYTEIGEGKDE